MKRVLFIFVLAASIASAWNPPIKEEAKLQYATWVGRGIISEKTFVQKTGDGYLWKAALLVSETIKGESSERLEFYFEQGEGPDRNGLYIGRCPPFPKVEKGDTVRIFLHMRPFRESECLFLNGDQMIENEPNNAMLPTPVDVTDRAKARSASSTSVADP